jgi:hypothetical protein
MNVAVRRNQGIIGVTNMSVEHGVGQPVKIRVELVAAPGYDPHHLLADDWPGMFPGNVVVKCSHCNGWAAVQTMCVHCGAPVG